MINDEWLDIMWYLYRKWICTYIDMDYYGELLAPTEFFFIIEELEK